MDERVGRWLESLGVGKYAGVFAENEITFEVLPRLTDADLKELGLPLGPRRVLSDALAALVSSTAADEVTEAARSATGRSAAERRQLTVMFVDLVGSTALSARLDPEEMGGVLRAYQNAVAGEIARFEGHVAKFMGDGVLAYFGWPKAHEDEAERAVRAGLAVRDAVAHLTGGDAPLACRIGLATGLVVVGELIGEGVAQEQTVVGDTPNLAARLQASAAPGQVVVGESTRRLLGAGFVLEELGAQALKGIEGAVGTFAVTGERVLASRFEARASGLQPMVDRDQELALLLERWAQAASGEGQAVLLVGEAGVGKSRISRALLDALGERPYTRIRYQCSPYHTGSALWPAIQQLEHAARFAPADPLETRLDKLEAALGGERAAESTALIARLVGLDGTARYGALELAPAVLRARTLEALVRQLLQLAAARPVLLLIEDAHWADPTTLELIEQWLDAIATAPVLLVITSRPDNQPALAAHPHVTRLSLNRLGRAGVEAIVARLGGDRLPPATVDAIIARTDGVPLYVEELTKAILETGETAIPASLHDSLMARLDRIPEVKEIAQIAACIGREFDYTLLAAVAAQPEPKIRDALERLAAAELIFRRGSPPEAHYTFKHALVRDAAYESLLRSRRQALHGRIVEALQHCFPERVSDQPEVVAHHYTGAGMVDQAVEYWERAGQVALAQPAYMEAAAHFGKGIRLLGQLGQGERERQRELGMLVQLGQALAAARGFGNSETVDVFSRARRLVDAMDATPLRLPVYWGNWAGRFAHAELPMALELAEDMVAIAAGSGDEGVRCATIRCLGSTRMLMGNFAAARDNLEQALALYDPQRDRPLADRFGIEPAVGARGVLSIVLWSMGYPDRAADMDAEAVSAARCSGHANSLGFALKHAVLGAVLARRHVRAAGLADECLQLASEHGLRMWEGYAEGLRGCVLLAAGDPTGAMVATTRGLEFLASTKHRLFTSLFLVTRARALAMLGQLHQSTAALDSAALMVEECSERWLWADLECAGGELAQCRAAADREQADPHAAEAHYGRALAIARAQEAHSWELRAAISLARLRAAQGQRQQARDLLAPVYDWFTEGFDTPDLVEAKALLDELH